MITLKQAAINTGWLMLFGYAFAIWWERNR